MERNSKWFRTESEHFYPLRNGSERKYEVFIFYEMVRNEIPSFFFFRGMARNGIPTGRIKISFCSVFRGIAFSRKLGTLVFTILEK